MGQDLAISSLNPMHILSSRTTPLPHKFYSAHNVAITKQGRCKGEGVLISTHVLSMLRMVIRVSQESMQQHRHNLWKTSLNASFPKSR
jgi:hypothetical protein